LQNTATSFANISNSFDRVSVTRLLQLTIAKTTRSVTPAEAGVQKCLFFLDSGFRRNDGKGACLSPKETVWHWRGHPVGTVEAK
jgi:hypothetical protein